LIPVLFIDLATTGGGAERSLISLLRGLDRARIKPVVMAVDDSEGGVLSVARELEIPSEQISAQNWKRGARGAGTVAMDILRLRPRVRGALREHGIQVVYANGIRAGLLATMTLPRATPLICHHRDFFAPNSVLRRVVSRANCTILVSEFIRGFCQRQLGGELAARLTTVYNGFDSEDLARLAAESAAEIPFSPEDPLVILVADMVSWKRHGLFLQAFAKVLQQAPKARALIVGGKRDVEGDAYLAELEATVDQLGIREQVHFTGSVANPLPLIAASRVLVSTADREPFGRTIIEALSCGVPVVTTKGGGPEEITADCAAVSIARPNPEAIAEAIVSWLPGPANAATTNAARACAARFPLYKTVDDVTIIIEAVASES
jgi:glycosyltransferase involved in cell wall biosynthesis